MPSTKAVKYGKHSSRKTVDVVEYIGKHRKDPNPHHFSAMDMTHAIPFWTNMIQVVSQ